MNAPFKGWGLPSNKLITWVIGLVDVAGGPEGSNVTLMP
jgi:hypothetical protein